MFRKISFYMLVKSRIIFHGNGAKISTEIDLIQVNSVNSWNRKKMKIYSKAEINKLIEQN